MDGVEEERGMVGGDNSYRDIAMMMIFSKCSTTRVLRRHAP